MHILKPMNRFVKYALLPFLWSLCACQATKNYPAVVAAENLQVVYNGIENPMSYAYTGYSCKDLIVVVEKGRAVVKSNEDCTFSIRPLGVWKEGLELEFYYKKVDEDHLIEKRKLRIEKIPLPVASLNGNMGTGISTGALKAVKIVSVVLEGFVFDGLRYQTSSFSYLVVKAKTKEVVVRGQHLGKEIPNELQEAFAEVEKGDLIHIFNIMAQPNHPRLPEVPVQNNLSLWVN